MPWTPAPGGVEAEQRYRPSTGVRQGWRESAGRAANWRQSVTPPVMSPPM